MNDNKPPAEQRPFEIDINVSWAKCLTNFVIRHAPDPELRSHEEQVIEYFVDGIKVDRDDFRAVMDLVTLVSRSRLTSV